ncbi:MAG: translation initiation factor IF-2 subunit gamma [Candidatus Micrarchaeota archaeon]|nr:translation initiation factor IF-2 subunit gamma [Candidatus Micrarchaeota archaeon]
MQAEVNIGMVGHVDHGKTSLTRALTGKWTDTHSEELKRGITIKIGYADATFYKSKSGEGYATEAEAKKEPDKWEIARHVSFLDAPGHETLMTTTIAASSIIDGAVLVIAANEQCPQPQTEEHLQVLDILGIKNVVVVQNKIDLIDREKAIENYKQIKKFLAGSTAENAPIIPISANYNANIDKLIEAIEKTIPTPKRDPSLPARMVVARSFDVNKPGSEISKLKGGVIGGSLMQGKLCVGDEIEMLPGITKKTKEKETIEPITLKVDALMAGGKSVQEVGPGGLIGVATGIDPALTKSDHLTGNLIGKAGTLPPVLSEITLEYSLLKREGFDNPALRMGEPIVISSGTATTLGAIIKLKGNNVFLKLKRPVCADKKAKMAITRKLGQRWRLSGFGILK